jgi:hypothetical protein
MTTFHVVYENMSFPRHARIIPLTQSNSLMYPHVIIGINRRRGLFYARKYNVYVITHLSNAKMSPGDLLEKKIYTYNSIYTYITVPRITCYFLYSFLSVYTLNNFEITKAYDFNVCVHI